ncbi:MAG: hypothetical protein Q9181_005000 [Wetmoreana brouardii]
MFELFQPNLYKIWWDLYPSSSRRPPRLYTAATYELYTLIQELLRKGANIDEAYQHGNTSLQYAARNGNVKVMELLLELGADVNAPGSRDGGRALWHAAASGSDRAVQILIDKGAEIDAIPYEEGEGTSDESALVTACENGHLSTARLLLAAGADVNAAAKKNDATSELIISKYSDLDDKLSVRSRGVFYSPTGRGVDALQATVARSGPGLNGSMDSSFEEIISFLLAEGACVNAIGGVYGTALQAAAFHGSSPFVQLLLESGADVNIQGGYCGNALQAAAWKGHSSCVQLLLDHGANVNIGSGLLGSPLQAALCAHQGAGTLARQFLEAGAVPQVDSRLRDRLERVQNGDYDLEYDMNLTYTDCPYNTTRSNE